MASLLNTERPSPSFRTYSSSHRRRNRTPLFDNCQVQVVGMATGSEEPLSYVVHVSTIAKGHWLVQHRYSHFAELRAQFFDGIKVLDNVPDKNMFVRKLQGLQFPRKHFFCSREDPNVIRERFNQLDIYLKSVLDIMKHPSMRAISTRPQHFLVRLVKKFVGLESNAKHRDFGPLSCSIWEEAKFAFI